MSRYSLKPAVSGRSRRIPDPEEFIAIALGNHPETRHLGSPRQRRPLRCPAREALLPLESFQREWCDRAGWLPPRSSAPGRVQPTLLDWGCPPASDSDSRQTPLPQSRAFLNPFSGLQINCSSVALNFLLLQKARKKSLLFVHHKVSYRPTLERTRHRQTIPFP